MTTRRARAPSPGRDGFGTEGEATTGPPPPPSPWRASRERQHDREVKREAVIRAAAHAFNLKGYHNTSLDDIAAALEVTKPTRLLLRDEQGTAAVRMFCRGCRTDPGGISRG